MSEFQEFLLSPDFAGAAALLIGGALLGAAFDRLLNRYRSERARRAAQEVKYCSR